MPTPYTILTIAGSDPSGGAGIQADIKTISALGGYAMAALTAVTAQNTISVSAVEYVSASMVAAQVAAVVTDIPPMAVKTGMLGTKDNVEAVVRVLSGMDNNPFIVVDPIILSSSGTPLLEAGGCRAMVDSLFPLATLVTPNAHEAVALTGSTVCSDQAAAFLEMGCKAVLLKGGDKEDGPMKTDLLYMAGQESPTLFTSPAIDTANTHGTGCTLSSAIATYLAMGQDLPRAVYNAKKFIDKALTAARDIRLGAGHGPLNHFHAPKPLAMKTENTNTKL